MDDVTAAPKAAYDKSEAYWEDHLASLRVQHLRKEHPDLSEDEIKRRSDAVRAATGARHADSVQRAQKADEEFVEMILDQHAQFAKAAREMGRPEDEIQKEIDADRIEMNTMRLQMRESSHYADRGIFLGPLPWPQAKNGGATATCRPADPEGHR